MISIVIPVYASGPWLEELVKRIETAMTPLKEPFEVILVNDVSPDTVTWPKIVEMAARLPWVHGIDLLYNTGQFRATLCGIEHARGDYVITMDDDLQHPPEELPKLVAAMHDHSTMDCIMGRYECKRHGILRNAGSRLVAGIMFKLYDKPADVVTTSFRIMRRDFAQTLLLYRVAHPQLGPLIVRLSRKVMNVSVEHHPRPHGRSGYALGKMMRETWQSIINASVAPLRFVSLTGAGVAALGFLYGAALVFRRAFGGITVPGYTSIIVTIAFFSGLILVSIGVLGEYLGRIIQELTGMPKYTVRETTAGKKNVPPGGPCGKHQ